MHTFRLANKDIGKYNLNKSKGDAENPIKSRLYINNYEKSDISISD